MNFLPLAIFFLFSSASDPNTDFFLEQARTEPDLRIEDAYKWLHQATRGGEHAITSEDAMRRWLVTEWATLGPPHPNEPLWQPLDPDDRIGRLHLRPYRARSGSPEPLLAAFLASAKSFDASPARFHAAWKALGRHLAETPQEHLTHAEWKRLDALARKDAYSARHHNPEYEKAHQPAYRVLTAEEARKLIDTLPSP